MEPISPPPVKKRKSEKSEKTSPGSLSPVSEEEHYTPAQSKVKKVSNQIRSIQTRTQIILKYAMLSILTQILPVF